MHVDAVLDHVAPTPGYVACDFHQHSYISPDAPVPPEDRVMSYLADGVDFISLVGARRALRLLAADRCARRRATCSTSAVGVETTPWDYGHFIGWPLRVDPLSPNGGALDWAGGEMALDLSPGEIFDGLRALGAQVVQINHPRSPPGAFSSFQQNFDRAGLTLRLRRAHVLRRQVDGSRLRRRCSGLPDGAPLFSDQFDSLEVYNGLPPPVGHGVDGERPRRVGRVNLRDWMNFLSFGFTPDRGRRLRLAPVDTLSGGAAAHAGGGARRFAGGAAAGSSTKWRDTCSGKGAARRRRHQRSVCPAHRRRHGHRPHGDARLAVRSRFTSSVTAPPGRRSTPSSSSPTTPSTCRCPRARRRRRWCRPCASPRAPAPSLAARWRLGGARPLTVTTVQSSPGASRFEVALDVNDVTPDSSWRASAPAPGQDLGWWRVRPATSGLFPVIPIGVRRRHRPGSIVDGRPTLKASASPRSPSPTPSSSTSTATAGGRRSSRRPQVVKTGGIRSRGRNPPSTISVPPVR